MFAWDDVIRSLLCSSYFYIFRLVRDFDWLLLFQTCFSFTWWRPVLVYSFEGSIAAWESSFESVPAAESMRNRLLWTPDEDSIADVVDDDKWWERLRLQRPQPRPLPPTSEWNTSRDAVGDGGNDPAAGQRMKNPVRMKLWVIGCYPNDGDDNRNRDGGDDVGSEIRWNFRSCSRKTFRNALNEERCRAAQDIPKSICTIDSES